MNDDTDGTASPSKWDTFEITALKALKKKEATEDLPDPEIQTIKTLMNEIDKNGNELKVKSGLMNLKELQCKIDIRHLGDNIKKYSHSTSNKRKHALDKR